MFAICGYSMGGRLAVLLAQELVQRRFAPKNLVLVSTGLGFETQSERDLRQAGDIAWAELLSTDAEAFWQKWYDQDLFRPFLTLPADVRQKWMGHRKSQNIKYLADQWRFLGPAQHEYLRPMLLELAKKNISVLYIAGELDKKYQTVARNLESPNIEIEIIQGAGHVIPAEAPDALARRVNTFLGK